MKPALWIATLLALTILHPAMVVLAQEDDPGTDPAGQGDADDGEGSEDVPEWVVPETFDSLLEEFKELAGQIAEDGGRPRTKFAETSELFDKVSQFNTERSPTEISLAVEVQLIAWNNQLVSSREETLARFEIVNPQNPGLRLYWANSLMTNQFNYDQAVEVLDGVAIDLMEYPSAAILRAECLIQLNRFEEAVSSLDALPEGARLDGNDLNRIYRVRREIDREAEAWATERELLDAETQADDLPRVEITTSKGGFTIELFENEAPNTVANFVSLVESGFYTLVKFHQVEPNFQVLTGDPGTKPVGVLTTQEDGPGYRIADEMPDEGYRQHWGGYLSMLTAGPDTGGSQFRITLRHLAHLDGNYTVFGRVIEGMRVIRNLDTADEILTTTILRKREHDYIPVRIEEPAEEGDALVEDPPTTPDDSATTDDGEGEDTGEEATEEEATGDDAGGEGATEEKTTGEGGDGGEEATENKSSGEGGGEGTGDG